MPASQTVRVEGLADLQRAFKLASREEAKGLRASLRESAEPVRSEAERLATSGIPRIGLPWSRMRVGVTLNYVYVAPKQRGSRFAERKRRNIAGLLADRAMLPALEHHKADVVSNIDQMLAEVGRQWERV